MDSKLYFYVWSIFRSLIIRYTSWSSWLHSSVINWPSFWGLPTCHSYSQAPPPTAQCWHLGLQSASGSPPLSCLLPLFSVEAPRQSFQTSMETKKQVLKLILIWYNLNFFCFCVKIQQYNEQNIRMQFVMKVYLKFLLLTFDGVNICSNWFMHV